MSEIKKTETTAPDDGGGRNASAWPIADPLLSAPDRVIKLLETALILSIVTGILYAWGLTYYSAFSEALGLSSYHFAFDVSPQEAVVAGSYVLVYFVGRSYYLLWSIAVGLLVVIVIVALAHLSASMLRRVFLRISTKIHSRRKRKNASDDSSEPNYSLETRQAFARIGRSAKRYFVYGILVFLLMVFLHWGDAQARLFGTQEAGKQLAACPQVEIFYGDGGKSEGHLCGRIGSDFILKLSQVPPRYVIVKGATIKQINIR
jgi:hypothetical protein